MTSDLKVLVVDDDDIVRDSLRALLESAGFEVAEYASATALLADISPGVAGCVVTDIRMPGMDGLELQEELTRSRIQLPVIVITGHGDVPLAVRAMKAGALDFIEKPFDDEVLLESVRRGMAVGEESYAHSAYAANSAANLATLTARERETMDLLVSGDANKVIAHKLKISPRTVEVHRGRVMEKMGARNLSDLVRSALAAGVNIDP